MATDIRFYVLVTGRTHSNGFSNFAAAGFSTGVIDGAMSARLRLYSPWLPACCLALFLLLTLAVAVAAAAPAAGPAVAPAAGATAAADPDVSAATAVTRAFYEYHFRHDKGFSEAGLRVRRQWLAPGLYSALLAEARKPKSPDEVPLIDGDPFTDSQEYPSSFRIGTAAKVRQGAREVVVDVVLVTGAATRPVRLVLAPIDGQYRIANFLFPGGGSPDLVKLLASGGH
jgi:hypothetical protein